MQERESRSGSQVGLQKHGFGDESPVDRRAEVETDGRNDRGQCVG